ncbi:C-Myc-binding protein isoform X2 [Pogona vitticeps]
MASSYKAADSKREQFRRYLEKSGVMDTLTKVLVALYEEPEKPNCALEYPLCEARKAGRDRRLRRRGWSRPRAAEPGQVGIAQYEPPQEEKRGE